MHPKTQYSWLSSFMLLWVDWAPLDGFALGLPPAVHHTVAVTGVTCGLQCTVYSSWPIHTAIIRWPEWPPELIIFSYFLYSWYSGIWGLADYEENAPSRASRFLQMANDLPGSVLFVCKLASQKPTHFTTSSIRLLYTLAIFLQPNYPSAR